MISLFQAVVHAYGDGCRLELIPGVESSAIAIVFIAVLASDLKYAHACFLQFTQIAANAFRNGLGPQFGIFRSRGKKVHFQGGQRRVKV